VAFLKQTAIVAGATAAAQLIQLAATPFLARVYSPEQFGLFALFPPLPVF